MVCCLGVLFSSVNSPTCFEVFQKNCLTFCVGAQNTYAEEHSVYIAYAGTFLKIMFGFAGAWCYLEWVWSSLKYEMLRVSGGGVKMFSISVPRIPERVLHLHMRGQMLLCQESSSISRKWVGEDFCPLFLEIALAVTPSVSFRSCGSSPILGLCGLSSWNSQTHTCISQS